jgi:hypothetical protein
MKAEIMLITPEMANKFLKRNVKNRNLNINHVKKLAQEMKSGRWVLNGVPIQFNDKGDLINGQHRLNAIIVANMVIELLVITGVSDPRAFDTIDQNSLVRGAHTILQLKGIPNATRMVSIAKKLMLWDQTEDKSNFPILAGKSQSTVEVANYFEENEGDITFIYDLMRDAKILTVCKAYSAVFAALIICFRNNEKDTLTFIEKFKTGAGLHENSPILLLREKLLHAPTKDSGRRWELEVMAMIIKSFNDHAAGRSRRLLRWNLENEKFPIPIKKISNINEVKKWKAN